MQTTEVTVKRNFVYNPLDMEHLHVSVTKTVLDGEDGNEVLQAALKEVEDFYAEVCKKNEPQYKNVSKLRNKEFNDAPYFDARDNASTKTLMEEFEECDNLETLKSYRFTHKTEEEQKYYDKKLKELF